MVTIFRLYDDETRKTHAMTLAEFAFMSRNHDYWKRYMKAWGIKHLWYCEDGIWYRVRDRSKYVEIHKILTHTVPADMRMEHLLLTQE